MKYKGINTIVWKNELNLADIEILKLLDRIPNTASIPQVDKSMIKEIDPCIMIELHNNSVWGQITTGRGLNAVIHSVFEYKFSELEMT